MNSVSSVITPGSIVATAKMLRSAKREVFFIVEGDDDIALLSESMMLPRANFISCFGKERLMCVYDLVPADGLDGGTIFFRDSDCDDVTSGTRDDVLLVVSDRYDFEMSLLPGRVFSRIVAEFLRARCTTDLIEETFRRIVEPAALIGALRHLSHCEGLGICFRDYKLRFMDGRTLSIDIESMVEYFLSRLKINGKDVSGLSQRLSTFRRNARDPREIASGKDFLKIMSVALYKFLRCCVAAECTFETLSRMFRISVTYSDIQELALYPILAKHIAESGFEWKGMPL